MTSKIAPFYTTTNLLTVNNIKHGFFSRLGGVSCGDFANLNVSLASCNYAPYNTNNTNSFTPTNLTDTDNLYDTIKNVTTNRQIIVNSLTHDLPNSSKLAKLVTLKQIHSNIVHVITKQPINSKPNSPVIKYHTTPPAVTTQGDALVTNIPNLIIGVNTADCVPILLVDPIAKVIASIHAGHKGAFDGVIQNTVKAMESLNCKPSNIKAAIGPCIWQSSYEIDENFYNKFIEQDIHNQVFFQPSIKPNHFLFSPSSYATKQLQIMNIKDIIQLGGFDIKMQNDNFFNTFNNSTNFFSHRYAVKNNITRGLQLSTIMLLP